MAGSAGFSAQGRDETFADVAARITALPPKHRPGAKEAARRAVDEDRAMPASARAASGVLIGALFWESGTTTRIGRMDLVVQTQFDRSTMSRALNLLRESGHILIQQKRLRADLFERNADTFQRVAAPLPPQ